ncbi:PDZ domain-containing protein [Candidatus Poribacteria bacterium]|nr:PDZ domain-containing protein [Candidatus Poribacteria bacterium]MYA58027.1 PDZ domain-containing protein [Candidatus Poribacteria bacterium]
MYARKLKRQLLIIESLSLLLSVSVSGFANESVLQRLEKDFQRIVTDARPTVVKVVATQGVPVPLSWNTKELALMHQNISSGIVIDTAGHIVTTTFEMGPPSKIEVIFNNKRVSSAKLIGTDVFTDIAVLRATGPLRKSTPSTNAIRSPAVPEEWIEFTLPRKWGDSSKIDTGSWVVTIGGSYGQSPIVSFGIVGGWDTLPNQLCRELIKINAAVTPGNSGGAVLNTSGEVVGMILAVLTEPTATHSPFDTLFEKQDDVDITQFLARSPLAARNQEITFAMPIETVRAVAKEIIEHGKVARGWLGVEVDIGDSGVLVTGVIENSPAHKGGLLPQDLILEFNEVPVHSYDELLKCVVSKRPNTEVHLKIGRNGTEHYSTVILGETP